MTVADIYDALSASDRPYKRAVPPERALAILEEEARDGFLDPALVALFIGARVWQTVGTGSLRV
jgi:HD-GYP domain-containing protein (c-di-GMP phosphodiesterase class II)